MYNKTLISQHTFFGGFCGVLLICDVRALKCRWSFWVGWKRTVYYLSKTVIFMFCFLYVIYWAHSYVSYLYSQYGIGQLACLYNYTVMYKYIHVYTHEPSHLQDHYFNVCTNVCFVCNIYIFISRQDISLVNGEFKACDFNEEILFIRYSTKR